MSSSPEKATTCSSPASAGMSKRSVDVTAAVVPPLLSTTRSRLSYAPAAAILSEALDSDVFDRSESAWQAIFISPTGVKILNRPCVDTKSGRTLWLQR